MNLIPFSAEHLRIQGSLPFDIVDRSGQLLMPRGSVLHDEAQLQQLLAHTLMVDAEQTEEWRRGLAGTIDSMVRRNVVLKTIARAGAERPAPAARHGSLTSLVGEVEDRQMQLALLLREPGPEPGWMPRMEAFAEQVRQLLGRDADSLLFLLVQHATCKTDEYSSHHAFLCAAVVELCAGQLGWSAGERHSLMLAALTMNLSMTSLQNTLAVQEGPPTAEQRRRIDEHPARSAALLRAAGVEDALWLEVIALHHGETHSGVPLAGLGTEQRLARMLRRADVFTAKISPRKRRTGLPAPLAARDACLGPDGRPDEVGAAMIKALGIYPPGSYVRLASGELALVMRRGPRADQPRVASIAGRDGQPLGVPALRDTADSRYEVKASVRTNEVRVRVAHAQLLGMR